MKPKITAANRAMYEQIEKLPTDAPVMFQGKPARFLGMTGYLVTLETQKKTVYLRAWDERLLEVQIPAALV